MLRITCDQQESVINGTVIILKIGPAVMMGRITFITEWVKSTVDTFEVIQNF